MELFSVIQEAVVSTQQLHNLLGPPCSLSLSFSLSLCVISNLSTGKTHVILVKTSVNLTSFKETTDQIPSGTNVPRLDKSRFIVMKKILMILRRLRRSNFFIVVFEQILQVIMLR